MRKAPVIRSDLISMHHHSVATADSFLSGSWSVVKRNRLRSLLLLACLFGGQLLASVPRASAGSDDAIIAKLTQGTFAVAHAPLPCAQRRVSRAIWSAAAVSKRIWHST
jgi:hypothetical protein